MIEIGIRQVQAKERRGVGLFKYMRFEVRYVRLEHKQKGRSAEI
jgi:hypothetical protein